MEIKTKTRTEQILTVMQILTWAAMITLVAEAGAFLISYGVSCGNPEAAKNLYKGFDLYSLRQSNFWEYTLSVVFIVALLSMKALIAWFVIKTFSKVNLANPFTTEMVGIIQRISYVLLAMWGVDLLNEMYIAKLLNKPGILQGDWSAGGSIFMAGLVFIISQLFKRGVEIQSENDLTV